MTHILKNKNLEIKIGKIKNEILEIEVPAHSVILVQAQ